MVYQGEMACEKHESMDLSHTYIIKISGKGLRNDDMYHWGAMDQPHIASMVGIAWTNIFYSLKLRREVFNDFFGDGRTEI